MKVIRNLFGAYPPNPVEMTTDAGLILLLEQVRQDMGFEVPGAYTYTHGLLICQISRRLGVVHCFAQSADKKWTTYDVTDAARQLLYEPDIDHPTTVLLRYFSELHDHLTLELNASRTVIPTISVAAVIFPERSVPIFEMGRINV